ncbi:MAG: Bacterial regulatory protein arsR family [Nocardioidaceae bacterium]|jgi:DNA-binding transcriptional ArsR family regulator|nr:Bacterial regulatory protein arsR family [Nocardioidaceae bacterium]
MRVRLGSGTGVELLVTAMGVADADWRVVFTQGPEAYVAALAAGGRPVAQDAGRIGRVGWTSLLGPLTRVRGAWSVDALRTAVLGLAAEELKELLLGRSGSAWLRRTDPAEVRATCLRVIDTLPPPAARAPVLARIRARLAEVGPEQLLDEVAPGLHYGPGVLDDVVLVTSAQVAPIVVELAEPDRTVIVHPPLGEAGATDAGARLRDLGRAMGDGTRMRVLHQLKGGESTLAELCTALDAPRTTLLHHLALLRGAGLVDLSVTAGEPNVYRLRLEGFDELGQVARAFPLL